MSTFCKWQKKILEEQYIMLFINIIKANNKYIKNYGQLWG